MPSDAPSSLAVCPALEISPSEMPFLVREARSPSAKAFRTRSSIAVRGNTSISSTISGNTEFSLLLLLKKPRRRSSTTVSGERPSAPPSVIALFAPRPIAFSMRSIAIGPADWASTSGNASCSSGTRVDLGSSAGVLLSACPARISSNGVVWNVLESFLSLGILSPNIRSLIEPIADANR